MNSRTLKIIMKCKDLNDQFDKKEQPLRETPRKVKYEDFWNVRKKKNWFCNRRLSLSDENISKGDEKNSNSPNVSSSSDPFADSGSSYVPSETEVSSSVPETPPDFDIYTPTSSTNISSDRDVTNTVEQETENVNVYLTNNDDDAKVSTTCEDVPLNNDDAVDEHKNDSTESTQRRFKKPKLKNFCYFCEADVTNFARHVTNNHSTELDVIKINALPPKSLQRKRLLAQLRNKGNFLNTANTCPRRVRRGQIPNTALLPCDNCVGYFSSKLLYRHRKNCGEKKSGRAQSDGQTVLAYNTRVDDRLKKEVFPHMRADKVSLEAKSDKLICSFGARYLRIHREKHFIAITSRKMRELSKILIEIKTIEPSIKSLFQALQPKYFDLFVQATKTVARYNEQTETFEAPSFAMNIVNSFKQCCDIAINFALKGIQQCVGIPAAEAEAHLKTMIHLFTANWRFEISGQASSNLHLNKWNKVTIVPLASDLKCLRSYLIQSAEDAVKKLNINENDTSAYNILVETSYCRVILLNRKRPGELQRMLLETYMNSGNETSKYEEFEKVITPAERVLLKKLKRIVIRGKRGRGVPVLFSLDVQNHIDVMLKYRMQFVPKDNLYLFAKAHCTSEISGYKILSKYANLCGAKNPSAISSTRLRKHLATLSQVFNMTEGDIEQLAMFMGHTPGIHRGNYRLPDEIYQTAKLSKLLILMENGKFDNYRGKCLEEIDINMEENLLEEAKDDRSDIEDEIEELTMGITDENELNIVNPEPENKINSKDDKTKLKKRRNLVPWTNQQKQVARSFFKEHIQSARPPKKHECEELIDTHPNIYHNKSWQKIKVFIQNEYTHKS